jgi:hypothetical protein
VGYINSSGSWAILPTLQHGEDFSEGLAPIRTSDGKLGYVDKTGKLTIVANCDLNFEFSDGLAIAIVLEGAPK